VFLHISQASVVPMSTSLPESHRTMSEVGEVAALAAILPLLPPAPLAQLGPGDDSAVVSAPDGRVVISCDMMIEGPDFLRAWSTLSDVGFKAVASNAADIAAMGAIPTGFEIALAAPGETTVGDLQDLATGFAEGIAALAPGAGVLGGDLSKGPVIMIAVTVLGDLEGRAPVTRSGAQPGDVVAVAGELGLSHQGFRALRASRDNSSSIRGLVETDGAVRHHLRPAPPIALGPLAARAGATAMMDISDGLVLDATRLAHASGVRLELDAEVSWSDDALFGGEDHGLLACFGESTPLPEGFRAIGVVLARGENDAPVSLQGRDLQVSRGGWDPFAENDAT
jgi:thiamine-monophosphate kinase